MVVLEYSTSFTASSPTTKDKKKKNEKKYNVRKLGSKLSRTNYKKLHGVSKFGLVVFMRIRVTTCGSFLELPTVDPDFLTSSTYYKCVIVNSRELNKQRQRPIGSGPVYMEVGDPR